MDAEKSADVKEEDLPIVGLMTAVIGDSNYGAMDENEENNDEGMIPAEFLDPLGLLIKSWGVGAPMIGPLALIVMMNFMHTREFTMECHEQPTPVAIVCSCTIEAVKGFPRIGVALSLLLMAWRMLHERVYYFLLKNKMMVDFGTNARFGLWTLILLVVLFLIACCHLVLKFCWGHPCDENGFCDPNKYMLNDHFYELVKDPKLLKAPQNVEALSFLVLCIMKYVLPAVICLTTLMGLLGLEAELLPTSKMLDRAPRKNYRELGGCVFVRESRLRAVLDDVLKPDSPDEGSARPRIAGARGEDVEWQDVCRDLVTECQKAGCFVLGDDAAKKSVVNGQLSQPHSQGFLELVNLRWWPSQLLLEMNLVDEDSVGFKRIMGMHYGTTFLILSGLLCVALYKFVQSSRYVLGAGPEAKVHVIPLIGLGLEMSFEVQWIMQVQRWAMLLFATYGVKGIGSPDAGSSTQSFAPEKAV